MTGLVLVPAQFICLFFLLFTTQPAFTVTGIMLIVAGLIILVWAVAAMRKSRLRIFPEPASDSTLIRNGPYNLIRHPMYTSLLTGVTGLLVMDPGPMRLAVFAILIVVLLLKLNHEEKLLAKKFREYEAYKKATYRLVPFLF